jgi:[ribosomal protein S5]-alanine N-acetyltransferase
MSIALYPKLEGQRIGLRGFEQDDIGKVFEGLSHPEIIKHYGVSYTTLEATQEQMDWYEKIYKEHTGIWWAITPKGNEKEIMGACGFNDWNQKHKRAEIGYWLFPDFQRKGLMSEAMQLIIAYGFDQMGLHRIEAIVETDNLASIWLLEKLGFMQEGVQKEAEIKNGKYIDLFEYALLNPHH